MVEMIRPESPWMRLAGTLAKAPLPYIKYSKKQYPPATNDCRKTAGDDAFEDHLIQLAEKFMINKITYNSDHSLDHKGDRHIDHISA